MSLFGVGGAASPILAGVCGCVGVLGAGVLGAGVGGSEASAFVLRGRRPRCFLGFSLEA